MEDRTNLTLIIYQFREIMRFGIEPRERRMLKVMFVRTFSDKYNKKIVITTRTGVDALQMASKKFMQK